MTTRPGRTLICPPLAIAHHCKEIFGSLHAARTVTRSRWMPAAFALLSLIPAVATAQDTLGWDSLQYLPQGPTCFVPRPRPACGRTIILEFSVGTPANGATYQPSAISTYEATMTQVAAEFGIFRNARDHEDAFGGSLGIARDGAVTTLIARVRYRRWLRGRLSAEVGPALYLPWQASNPSGGTPTSGGGVRFTLNYEDRLAFFVEPRQFAQQRTVMLGATVGTGWGVPGVIVAGIGALVGLQQL